MTDEQKSNGLPALYNITKSQMLLASSAAGASVFFDIATHANPGVMFLGGLAAVAVGATSKELAEMLIPGSNPDRVRTSLDALVTTAAPDVEEDYADQRPLSKIRRMFGSKDASLYEPQDVVMPGEVPAQPKGERLTPPAQNTREDDDGPVFSIGPEQETLRLGKVLKTGQRFDPSFKKLFGRGWVAAANQGFGKSILNGVIIEQAGKCDLRVIVLDHKGEYGPVEELPFMNALRVGAGSDFDFPLAVDNADRLVESVMVNRYQAIVDLPSYGDGWLDRAEIVAAVGQALMRYANRQRAAGRKMKQCLIILDEAQLYLPQNAALLPAEASRNQGVLSDLNNAYFSLVSNGRSAGYTLGFATQSLTYLAKWAIKSTGVKIYGRHIERNDLNAILEDVDPQVATRKELASFPPGVGVVFGFTDEAMVVQFDHKQSRDVSFTPGFDSPDDEDEEEDEVEQFLSFADDVDPDDDRYEDEEDDEEIEPLTPDLQAVYDVYRQYMSDRKIAQILATTHATVGKKKERLFAMGYIDRKTGAKLV